MNQCNHKWVVFSTAVVEVQLMVECVSCGAIGAVARDHFTHEDWCLAFDTAFAWNNDVVEVLAFTEHRHVDVASEEL